MYEALISHLRDCAKHDPYENTFSEAADAIEELSKPRWIPVTERLPQDEEIVFTWGNQETILLDWRHDNKWCCFGEVTHWIPLPEPPKEE